VDGRLTNSHGNKTSRSRSVVKQKGMVFGFRKMVTAVVGPEIDRYLIYNHFHGTQNAINGLKNQTANSNSKQCF
jgi:phage-related protein